MGFVTQGFTPAFYASDYSGSISSTNRDMLSGVDAGWYEVEVRFMIHPSNAVDHNYAVITGFSPARYIKVSTGMNNKYYHEKILAKVTTDDRTVRIKTNSIDLKLQFVYLSMKKIAEL